MTERQKRIQKLVLLPNYLAQLGVLIGRRVSAEELKPPEDIPLLQDKIRSIPAEQMVRVTIPFEARNGSAFLKLIDQLQVLNGSPVFPWPPDANDCGLLLLPSLKEINFGFPFELIPDGILGVVTRDGLDSMLLDFSEDQNGRKVLELELHGPHWSRADLSKLMAE